MKIKTLTILLAIGMLFTLTPFGLAQGTNNWSHVSLDGAGASFPYPVYSLWAYEYEELTDMKLNYQSVGSGAGISSIQAGTVNFGASDKPLHAEELDEYGLIQFPMIIGGVVPVINIPGIKAGELKFTPDVLAKVFLGDITNWNDPAITSLNPRLNIPDKAIVVVHRADGSGTTWIFSNYMSSVSRDWEEKVGIGKSLEWPVGIGGRGNEGIANYVASLDGAIGYVEYAYSLQNNLTYCLLKNRSGNFAAPTADSFAAAAGSADWANAPGYYMVLVNQQGAESWPIVGASFILIYKEQDDMDTARGMLEYFDWCYRSGQESALSLDYVPIPMNVIEMVENTWAENVTCNGRNVWQ